MGPGVGWRSVCESEIEGWAEGLGFEPCGLCTSQVKTLFKTSTCRCSAGGAVAARRAAANAPPRPDLSLGVCESRRLRCERLPRL